MRLKDGLPWGLGAEVTVAWNGVATDVLFPTGHVSPIRNHTYRYLGAGRDANGVYVLMEAR